MDTFLKRQKGDKKATPLEQYPLPPGATGGFWDIAYMSVWINKSHQVGYLPAKAEVDWVQYWRDNSRFGIVEMATGKNFKIAELPPFSPVMVASQPRNGAVQKRKSNGAALAVANNDPDISPPETPPALSSSAAANLLKQFYASATCRQAARLLIPTLDDAIIQNDPQAAAQRLLHRLLETRAASSIPDVSYVKNAGPELDALSQFVEAKAEKDDAFAQALLETVADTKRNLKLLSSLDEMRLEILTRANVAELYRKDGIRPQTSSLGFPATAQNIAQLDGRTKALAYDYFTAFDRLSADEKTARALAILANDVRNHVKNHHKALAEKEKAAAKLRKPVAPKDDSGHYLRYLHMSSPGSLSDADVKAMSKIMELKEKKGEDKLTKQEKAIYDRAIGRLQVAVMASTGQGLDTGKLKDDVARIKRQLENIQKTNYKDSALGRQFVLEYRKLHYNLLRYNKTVLSELQVCHGANHLYGFDLFEPYPPDSPGDYFRDIYAAMKLEFDKRGQLLTRQEIVDMYIVYGLKKMMTASFKTHGGTQASHDQWQKIIEKAYIDKDPAALREVRSYFYLKPAGKQHAPKGLLKGWLDVLTWYDQCEKDGVVHPVPKVFDADTLWPADRKRKN